jgi:hypothetical protein
MATTELSTESSLSVPRSDQQHRGSCLCESVTYTVTGPAWLSYLCHCRNCQRASGGAFNANCFFPRDQFEVLQGKDKVSVFSFGKTGSGNVQHRHFCSTCATPLYILPENKPEVVVIFASTMNDFRDFKPQQECWVKHRVSWLQDLEGTQKFDGSRPMTSGRPQMT